MVELIANNSLEIINAGQAIGSQGSSSVSGAPTSNFSVQQVSSFDYQSEVIKNDQPRVFGSDLLL